MDEQTIIKGKHFAEIVRRYCSWAESASVGFDVDMQTAQSILAELHFAILDLRNDDFEDDVELENVSTEQWKIVKERFTNLPIDGYWLVFDPTKDRESETVFTTLSEDLADIYRDLKYGLLLFDAGHIAKATWEWKFNFQIHWGRHLVDAQKVIYSWFFNNGEL